MECMQDRLVYLIGSPRSGSTLLSRILGAHPEIFAPEEPHLITPMAHLGYYESVESAPYDPIITRAAARARAPPPQACQRIQPKTPESPKAFAASPYNLFALQTHWIVNRWG